MIMAVLEELETYIIRRQNKLARYITTWTILDLCQETEKHQGPKVKIMVVGTGWYES